MLADAEPKQDVCSSEDRADAVAGLCPAHRDAVQGVVTSGIGVTLRRRKAESADAARELQLRREVDQASGNLSVFTHLVLELKPWLTPRALFVSWHLAGLF